MYIVYELDSDVIAIDLDFVLYVVIGVVVIVVCLLNYHHMPMRMKIVIVHLLKSQQLPQQMRVLLVVHVPNLYQLVFFVQNDLINLKVRVMKFLFLLQKRQ